MTDRRLASALLLLLVVGYVAIGFSHLGVVPPVHEDEPWQASTGRSLACNGKFASDLFDGFHGMERRYYGFPPIHPLLLAAIFRTFGVGLEQARFETALLGLTLLLLTGALAARLFDRAAGVAAMAVLLVVPWIPTAPFRVTGIPLLDQARLARYDMGVAVFGLAAVIAFDWAMKRGSPWRHAFAGILVAAAGLCQLHGFFFLPVLLALGLWNKARRRDLAALVGGVVVGTLPYAVYVLRDLPTFFAQTYQYADRFRLLDPGWYAANLRAEPHRYGLGSWRSLAHPGPMTYLAGVPAVLVILLHRACRRDDRGARILVLPALVLPCLLALMIAVKQPGYLLVAVPFGAIALGWGLLAAWRAAGKKRVGWLPRTALALLTAIVLLDGLSAVAAIGRRARSTTPYARLMARVRPELPPDGRILAPHRFWFGLEDREVRSWWVPFALADARHSRPTVEAAASLTAIDPDAVVVDDQVRAALLSRLAVGAAFQELLERQGLDRVVELTDPTYGLIQVYRRREGAGGSARAAHARP
jgi:4-amino-4-deoxy-L-arabinose transferase-like glycosyltransferase